MKANIHYKKKLEYVRITENTERWNHDKGRIEYQCLHCKRWFNTYGQFQRHLTIKRGCIKLEPWSEVGKI